MSNLHLKDFAKERGQPEAALILGVTQGALSKAIRIGRNIIVTQEVDGTFSAEERRAFPARIDRKCRSGCAPTLNANLRPNPAAYKSTDGAGVLSSSAGVA
ncbi:Cro/CI family transcriptional regulator [Pseudomonas sp. SIMBA_059]